MIPLALLNEGERAIIKKINNLEVDFLTSEEMNPCEGGCLFCKKNKGQTEARVKNFGLKVGQVIEVKLNQPGHPLLVSLENTQIAISRGLAMKILVNKF